MLNKIYVILVIGAIAALMFGGVLEVKVHPDKVAGLSKNTLNIFKDQNAVEKGRALFIKFKRRGEQFIIRDKEKRLELALLYVEKDAERLNDLIKEDKEASHFLPASQALIESLNLVRSTAEDAPVDVVASLKTKSQEAFSSAQETLGELKDIHGQYEAIQNEFTRLTESLEKQIGNLELEEDENNKKEENNEKPNESSKEPEKSAIPLKF